MPPLEVEFRGAHRLTCRREGPMRALGFFALIVAAPLAHADSDPAGSSATKDDEVKAAVLAEREASSRLGRFA